MYNALNVLIIVVMLTNVLIEKRKRKKSCKPQDNYDDSDIERSNDELE